MATQLLTLVDKALGGTLEARLRDLRANGLSYEDVAFDLRTDDITVTGETVRKWCLSLGIDNRSA